MTPASSARTFPSVRIRPHGGGLPVEVTLIAALERGAGNRLIAEASARQSLHEHFVDALDEPSARIGASDFANGDASSLYTFAVGANGHPFHRHAGQRMFTAVAGGAGVRLRFSTASDERIGHDSRAFVEALHHVDVPADCLFTVRFGGGTWHQFVPLRPDSGHPALFALSCHANELGGELAPALRRRVLDGEADIPALTELLPSAVRSLLESAGFDASRVPTTVLSFGTAPDARPARFLAALRRGFRRAHALIGDPLRRLGSRRGGRRVRELAAVPEASLLRTQLTDARAVEDTFELIAAPGEFATASAREALAAVLAGFLESRPPGVSCLMTIRNAVVAPLGLRTSRLGCPASSLLSEPAGRTFAGRFPVLAQRVDATDVRAEVILGADDRHLAFRSCVGVERLADGRMRCTLGTRVRTLNAFGRFYIAAIGPVHRAYIAPAMLRRAVEHALRECAAANGPGPAAGDPDAVVRADSERVFRRGNSGSRRCAASPIDSRKRRVGRGDRR